MGKKKATKAKQAANLVGELNEQFTSAIGEAVIRGRFQTASYVIGLAVANSRTNWRE